MTTDHDLRGGSALSRAAADAVTAAAPRQPAWSGRLTRPLAARIPAGPGTLRAIKAIHSAAFAAIAASVVVVAWDGVRAQPATANRGRGGDRPRRDRRLPVEQPGLPADAARRGARRRERHRHRPLPAALAERPHPADRAASRSIVGVGAERRGARPPATHQPGTTTTSHGARRTTSDETLPRISRRRFVRGREPSTMTSACSATDASTIDSAGIAFPDQERRLDAGCRAPAGRSPARRP